MILSTAVRRTTAAKNPRTVCGCQPVEVIIVAMVTPPGRLSSLSTRACFEPAQASLLRSWRFPHARSSNANNLCARILLVSRKSVRSDCHRTGASISGVMCGVSRPARAFWQPSNVQGSVASFSGPVHGRARALMPPGFPARLQANADRLGRARNHVRSRSRTRARECGFPGSDPFETPDLADDDPSSSPSMVNDGLILAAGSRRW